MKSVRNVERRIHSCTNKNFTSNPIMWPNFTSWIYSKFFSQFTKEMRIRQAKLSPKIVNKVPGASFCLYFALFTPFVLFGIIIIAYPYMIEDYTLTECIRISTSSHQTSTIPVRYYAKLHVNYTYMENIHQGFKESCASDTPDERNKCIIRFAPEFPCFIEIDYQGESPLEDNRVFTPDEYNMVLSSNSKIFAIFLVISFVLLIFSYLAYKLCQWILKKYILENITDEELELNKYGPEQYEIRYGSDTGKKGDPFENKLFKYIASTAVEKREKIEWVYRPRFLSLIRSHSWIMGCYIFIGMLPIMGLCIYFAIFSIVRYPWKNWALYVIEFAIAYVILLYLFYVFVYLFSAFRTKYYITTSRSICVMRFFAVVWIQQFPHSDIGEVQRTEEKSGAVVIISKKFGCPFTIFSYVENLEIIRSMLMQRMNYEEREDDFDEHVIEKHLGESLPHQDVVVESPSDDVIHELVHEEIQISRE